MLEPIIFLLLEMHATAEDSSAIFNLQSMIPFGVISPCPIFLYRLYRLALHPSGASTACLLAGVTVAVHGGSLSRLRCVGSLSMISLTWVVDELSRLGIGT